MVSKIIFFKTKSCIATKYKKKLKKGERNKMQHTNYIYFILNRAYSKWVTDYWLSIHVYYWLIDWLIDWLHNIPGIYFYFSVPFLQQNKMAVHFFCVLL